MPGPLPQPPLSRLRMTAYLAVIAALAFAQSGGRQVADTKFDLLTSPGGFLSGATQLWDPQAAFGQIQNQAYGYLWPMGPFFLLGDLLQVPGWVIQRAWWVLLIGLAFFGVVHLCRRMGVGSPTAQLLAAVAYVLTPRITTLLGPVSVEVWPMAIAPWVLWALVRGTQDGSVRRWAALAALLVACAGGVNAVAAAGVLPLGVLWLLTRERGPRKWPLLGWWTLFTLATTAWWWMPLLLMGRYSVPFLDYIETAALTTAPTDITRTFLGISDWIAYIGGIDFTAGQQILATPFLLLDAAAVAALGLAGILWRDNPHRRFLVLGVLGGLALVGVGYAGDLAGFWASTRQGGLDGALAPLRNLHKFDVVLRLPLVLGLAHLLTKLGPYLSRRTATAQERLDTWNARVMAGVVVLALFALATPWLQDQIAPRLGAREVPRYWEQAASYLDDTDDGSVSLVLPAATFGVYTWGNLHDDVMQGVARSPWAVRNVAPFAQPGNVVMLDAITRAVESGRPQPGLAAFLHANGVGRLVVRNDLHRLVTGTPDPALLRSVLEGSPGIELVESFGPRVGAPLSRISGKDRTRIVGSGGISAVVGSVDVYQVAGGAGATVERVRDVLTGDPGSALDAGFSSDQRRGTANLPLAADGPEGVVGTVLTDGMRRREKSFAAVRRNESATMQAITPFRLFGREHQHRVLPSQKRWSTTEVWVGEVVQVFASSAQSQPDAAAPIDVSAHPGAAVDGTDASAWSSARPLKPLGQWWQLDFVRPQAVPVVTIRMGRTSAPVSNLTLSTGSEKTTVLAPRPGRELTYDVDLARGDFFRVTASGRLVGRGGEGFSLADVDVPDLTVRRALRLPDPPRDVAVDVVSLTRDRERAACLDVDGTLACDATAVDYGEDGNSWARLFRLRAPTTYGVTATASMRRLSGLALQRALGVSVWGSTPDFPDVGYRAVAMVDGDPETTWVASGETAALRVRLPAPVRVSSLQLRTSEQAAAAQPLRVVVRTAEGDFGTVLLDAEGRGRLPGWTTDELTVRVVATRPAITGEGTGYRGLPVGVSTLKVNDAYPTPSGGVEQVTIPCGAGPQIQLGSELLDTSATTSASSLLRGRQVVLEICADRQVSLPGGVTGALLGTSGLLRVDSVTLTRKGYTPTTPDVVPVERDSGGQPGSLELGSSTAVRILTLPQNLNVSWQASLKGKELTPVRVSGWKQGFVVPADVSGTVRFSNPAAGVMPWILAVGGALVLVVAAVALLAGRRTSPAPVPAAATGAAGLLDVLALVGVAGWLGGWPALAAVTVGAVVVWQLPRASWPAPVGGLAVLVAGLAVSWTWLSDQEWSRVWSQSWGFVALGALAAGLLSTWSTARLWPRVTNAAFFRRIAGRSRTT